jgi:hypothetical protein
MTRLGQQRPVLSTVLGWARTACMAALCMSCGGDDERHAAGGGSGGAAAGGAGGSGASSTGGLSSTGGAPGSGGQSSGGADASTSGGSAGTPATGGAPPDGGAVTCDPACGGDTPFCQDGQCVECRQDTPTSCGPNDTPRVCENGTWVLGTPCGGATPVCAGGVCAPVALVGGLTSTGLTGASGLVHLVDHGFEGLKPVCADVNGERICVSGSIQP